MIIIGIVICVVFMTFLVLAFKKKIYKSLNRGNISKKLDYIERIDTWLSILIWCEVVLFICLLLVL
jgi:CBS domain containing-hemolysin-like protein